MEVMVAMEAATKHNQIMATAKEVTVKCLGTATNLNPNPKRKSKYSFTLMKQQNNLKSYLSQIITQTPIAKALSATMIRTLTR